MVCLTHIHSRLHPNNENNFCVYTSAEIKTNQNTATISDMQRQVKKSENFYTIQKTVEIQSEVDQVQLGEEGIESLCWLKVVKADTTKGI